MVNEEGGQSESPNIHQIYSDFMTRVTTFEELWTIGNSLLLGFQQSLRFIARPPINKVSTLIDRIVEFHGSKRLLSYVEAGCKNTHDSVLHVSKLHTSHLGLQDHINKAKIIVDELECLVDDASLVVRISDTESKDLRNFDSLITSSDDEELPSTNLSKQPKATDYAAMMVIVYSMVKQDYKMQVRIVSSLNLKTSPEELETYCQMWSLRPFIDDDLMRKAWGLVQ